MFRRLFVANRGEVAARLVRAAHALDLEVVCAASTADLEAGFPYLDAADDVVCLGPGPAAQSYLKAEEVVQAAVQSGCSALHPGWGFLAEDPAFASLCAQHGVTFVGPAPGVMDRMGRKVSSREAARDAGLPVVPGSHGLLADAAEAARVAEEVGYPVVLKADAGGGGRGIRRCDGPEELEAAFQQAAREAETAFGSGALYLEKYLVGGRHIEVQVLGDGRGQAIHLGDRECSIQRRHQKLLEEAPVLAPADRASLGARSAAAAASWHYAGAGTMEFLLDQEGAFHFLEMNTRLQVEHPVTEMVTGIDLVEAQLRIAAGGPLPCAQGEVRWEGHAIELRLNAEDADQDFRPSPGLLENFAFPEGCPGLRVDTHLAAGSRIGTHYDSLLAKVILLRPDRAACIDGLLELLDGIAIAGVATTADLHRRVLAHEDFRRGATDTLWLEGMLAAGS